MNEFASLAKPSIVPPLHNGFAPASLAVREFLKAVEESGRGTDLVIALERSGGQISVYRTRCFEEGGGNDELNWQFAERLVKFLLWRSGGWRIIIGGPESIGRRIDVAYSPGGIRSWDADFMGKVYERPFTVEFTEPGKVPEPNEGTVALGGHLDGCRIGFDLGASDRKVSAVIDGETVYTEEVVWDPRNATDPDYHFNEINSALKAAAAKMPRVDAIGGSAAGIYVNNRPRAASLFRGVPSDLFESRIANLFLDLKKEWGNVPFEVVNDGEVTALAGAMTLKDGAVLGIALGSSEAGGYVTPTGEITTWLNELAFCPVDVNPDAPVDEWSGDYGCGVQYFSQQAVFRLASEARIEVDPTLGPAEKLKWVQSLLQAGNENARQIWKTIGIYLGYGIAHYANFYDLRHVLILGRVTSGEGGSIILNEARDVLGREFPELAEGIKLHLPDESSRRVGQAVAAASLPVIEKRE
ncbi:MAG: ROK family protein [Armatimonadetes bacterium]|nr:ROK family protein [Armatimonadota bacterium]